MASFEVLDAQFQHEYELTKIKCVTFRQWNQKLRTQLEQLEGAIRFWNEEMTRWIGENPGAMINNTPGVEALWKALESSEQFHKIEKEFQDFLNWLEPQGVDENKSEGEGE